MPGCCSADADCNDGNPCTIDSCESGQCKQEQITYCCQSLAQCETDNDPCTVAACLSKGVPPEWPPGARRCQAIQIEGCCHSQPDCVICSESDETANNCCLSDDFKCQPDQICAPKDQLTYLIPPQPNTPFDWCISTGNQCSNDTECPLKCLDQACTSLDLFATAYCERRQCDDRALCRYEGSPWDRQIEPKACLVDSDCVDSEFPLSKGRCLNFRCDFFSLNPLAIFRCTEPLEKSPPGYYVKACPPSFGCIAYSCEYDKSAIVSAFLQRYGGTPNNHAMIDLQEALGTSMGTEGLCLPSVISNCTPCSQNSDCDDNSDCTADSCLNGRCVFAGVPDCCRTSKDCVAPNPCVVGTCYNAVCQWESTSSVCCSDHADCNAGLLCETGLCVPYVNECVIQQDEHCCWADEDCADDLICVNGSCVQSSEPTGQVCSTSADCNAAACSDICVNCQCLDGVCVAAHVRGCCHEDLRLLVIEKGLSVPLKEEIDELLLDWQAEGACTSVIELEVEGDGFIAPAIVSRVGNETLRSRLKDAYTHAGLSGVMFLGRVGFAPSAKLWNGQRLGLLDDYWTDLDDDVFVVNDDGRIENYMPSNGGSGLVVGSEIVVGRLFVNKVEAEANGGAVEAYKKYLRKLHAYRMGDKAVAQAAGIVLNNYYRPGSPSDALVLILTALKEAFTWYEAPELTTLECQNSFSDSMISVDAGLGVNKVNINKMLAKRALVHILLASGGFGPDVFDTWYSASTRSTDYDEAIQTAADKLAFTSADLHRGLLGSPFVIGQWPGSTLPSITQDPMKIWFNDDSIGLSLIFGNSSTGLVFIGRPGQDVSMVSSLLVRQLLLGQPIGEAVRQEVLKGIPAFSSPWNPRAWTLWGDPFLRARPFVPAQ